MPNNEKHLNCNHAHSIVQKHLIKGLFSLNGLVTAGHSEEKAQVQNGEDDNQDLPVVTPSNFNRDYEQD